MSVEINVEINVKFDTSSEEAFVESVSKFFGLTVNGFLPLTNKFSNVPSDIQAWLDFADNIGTHNKNKTTRTAVMDLPDLNLSKMNSFEDGLCQRLYAILAIIGNSYVWCNPEPPTPTNVGEPWHLPAKIAIPLHKAASTIGIEPILTHAAVDLYNWELKDSNQPISLDNLKSINLMTLTPSEEWFYLVMVAIEAIGGRILRNILKCHYRILMTKNTDISSLLAEIVEDLAKCTVDISRIREKCEPSVFWNVLRPYLSGWENDRFKGMVYEGVSNEPVKLAGGSAAQSSLFATIDAAFGVTHSDAYFQKIQSYMPKRHRDFITFVKQNKCIPTLAESSKNSGSDSDMKIVTQYSEVIEALTKFRRVHFATVHTYILANINANSKDGEADDGINKGKGTGGTDLKTFLKGSIKETKETIA